MADWSKPTNSSTYQNYTSENDSRMDDLAVGLDPAVTTPTNLPAGTIRWSSANAKFQKLDGTGNWNDLSTLYSVNISGNAATATTLATARTINGVSFNGSANVTVTANTPNSLTLNSAGGGATSGSTFNGSAGVAISYNSVGAPSTTGTNASGTWGIDITGKAATATARNINGVSFNHSADVVVEPYVENDETSNATRYISFVQSSASAYKRLYADTGLSYNPNNNTISANVSGNASSANSVPWSGVSGKPTSVSSFSNDSGYITSGGRAYPRRSDGGDLNFAWTGQSGQPTWLWGGSDGINMYVYNPSNFSVNYATSAGSAGSAGTAGYASSAGSATNSTNSTYASNPSSGGSFITSNNIGGQSVNYANSANYASSAGSANSATTATNLSTTSGSAPIYGARAWVIFNGQGVPSIRASGNVSSITDYATGDYGINFVTAMPDQNYSMAGCVDGIVNHPARSIGFYAGVAPLASSCRVATGIGGANTVVGRFDDCLYVSATFFR